MEQHTQKQRFLCIYLPSWSTDLVIRRLRAQSELPHEILALIGKEANSLIVKRVSPQAYALGIRENMPLVFAQALVPSLITAPFSAEHDCRSLFGLASWAQRFTPLVAIDSELLETIRKKALSDISRQMYGLVLNLTGTTRLHKNEDQLIEQLRFALKRNGYNARFALANTIAVAWAFSRFAKRSRTIIKNDKPALESISALPIQALRISPVSIKILHEVGITSIAQLLKISRREIARQTGFETLKRIDQSQGAVPEPISYLKQEKNYTEAKTFHAPLESKNAIQETVRLLLEKLSGQLLEKQLTAVRFIVRFYSSKKGQLQSLIAKELCLSSGCTSAAQVSQVIIPFVESINICSGIETISLTAPTPLPLRTSQATLPSFRIENSELCHADLDLMLNQCAARFGPDSVQQVSITENYCPEKSFSFQPQSIHSPKKKKVIKNSSAYLRIDTPPKIITPPQELRVISLLPDYTPAHIQWRGRRLKVIKVTGPERITESWQNKRFGAEIGRRDYFKVQESHGQWLWIFREDHNQRWFIHGLWI